MTFWSGPALAIYWLGGQHEGAGDGVVVIAVIAGAVLFSFIVVMLLFTLGDCCCSSIDVILPILFVVFLAIPIAFTLFHFVKLIGSVIQVNFEVRLFVPFVIR